MTGQPTPVPVAMPCPHGCAHQLAPGDTCPHCGHQLTIAEQRRLEQKDRGRAAIARARAEWERFKDDHPRGQRRTA